MSHPSFVASDDSVVYVEGFDRNVPTVVLSLFNLIVMALKS
jgi:hypothetical protein